MYHNCWCSCGRCWLCMLELVFQREEAHKTGVSSVFSSEKLGQGWLSLFGEAQLIFLLFSLRRKNWRRAFRRATAYPVLVFSSEKLGSRFFSGKLVVRLSPIRKHQHHDCPRPAYFSDPDLEGFHGGASTLVCCGRRPLQVSSRPNDSEQESYVRSYGSNLIFRSLCTSTLGTIRFLT